MQFANRRFGAAAAACFGAVQAMKAWASAASGERQMSFALGLGESLRVRESLAPHELANGDSLERVLSRYLLAVEAMADGILTSILLLDPEGKSLWHGAAPNLPRAYCEAIDGIKIGPNVGSCGTAAYFGRAVYVTDIASDPLWADFRHIALPHDLRACWSTPIRDPDGAVIGTFAIYHRTVSGPTLDEIEAIEMITDHVAQAILLSRDIQDVEVPVLRQDRARPFLTLVPGSDSPGEHPVDVARLLQSIVKFLVFANELDRLADKAGCESTAEALRAASADCRRLGSAIRSQVENQKV